MHTSARRTRQLEDQVLPGAALPHPAGRRGRAALWALGGAALATAVWGGALLLPGDSSAAPEVRHRLSEDLCADAELAALAGVYDRGDGAMHAEHRHRAMDVAECNTDLAAKDAEGSAGQALTLRMKLHKATDPRAEFEANGEADETTTGPRTVKTPVEGLGDRAYFGTIDLGGSSIVILMALEGGAEFSFHLTADADRTPEEIKPLMIRDMRSLMAHLER